MYDYKCTTLCGSNNMMCLCVAFVYSRSNHTHWLILKAVVKFFIAALVMLLLRSILKYLLLTSIWGFCTLAKHSFSVCVCGFFSFFRFDQLFLSSCFCIASYHHFCCMFIISCAVSLAISRSSHFGNAKCVFNAITSDTHLLVLFHLLLILSLLIMRDTLAVSQAFRVYVASITTKLSEMWCVCQVVLVLL